MDSSLPREPSSLRNIVILGAGGYFGGSLCRFFHSLSDYSVTALFRREPNHRYFGDCLIADAFADNWANMIRTANPFAVINCAFDFVGVGKTDYQAKYAALERNLATLCAHHPVKLINISTTSAYRGCRTEYGHEKLFVEEIFKKYNGLNLRPGLLVSWRSPGAAMLRLIEVTRKSALIPLLVARRSGFWICDLEAAVLAIYLVLNMNLNKAHTLSFCYGDRLSLRQIFGLIEQRYGIRKLKVPVPWQVVHASLVVKEAFLGRSKIRADSLIDFAYPSQMAYGRGAFARMIDWYRGELIAIGKAGLKGVDGFYFLEGERGTAESMPRRCRLQAIVESRHFIALRGLADS